MFGQVKEWLILEFHKIIRVLHAVACAIVFILLYDQGWQGRVFKVLKNDHFSVFLALCPFPPSFWTG